MVKHGLTNTAVTVSLIGLGLLPIVNFCTVSLFRIRILLSFIRHVSDVLPWCHHEYLRHEKASIKDDDDDDDDDDEYTNEPYFS